MLRALIVAAVLLLPHWAMAQEPPDILVQTLGQQLSATVGTIQMLIQSQAQLKADVKNKTDEVAWWRAYVEGLNKNGN